MCFYLWLLAKRRNLFSTARDSELGATEQFCPPAPDTERGATEQFCPPAPDIESGTQCRLIKLVFEVVKDAC